MISSSWPIGIFRASLLAVLLVGAAGAEFKYWRSLRSPLPLDYGEGIVLWQAQHILERDKTYRNIDTPPYNVTHYPPLYHLAVRAVVGEDGDWLYAGRLVSFVSGTCLMLVLGVTTLCLLPRRTSRWDKITAASLSGCSLLLDSPSEWMQLARVDFLGLTIMFSGLAILCVGRKQLRWELFGITLLVAAGFTKHVFFTVPAACLLAQALVDYRRLAIWAAWGTGCAGIPLLYLQSLTGGGFLLNLLHYNWNPFSYSTLFRHLDGVLRSDAALIAFGVPVLVYGMIWLARHYDAPGAQWRQKIDRSNFRWYLLVLAVHLLIAGAWLIGMGKVGSAPNYALPFLLTLNLGAGVTTWHILSRWRTKDSVFKYLAVCLALIVGVSLLPEARSLFRAELSPGQVTAVKDRTRLIARLRADKGPIYSEDMVALLQAGHDVPAEPAMITLLAEAGYWDETAFVQGILDQKWSLILVNYLAKPERYTPAVRRAILRAYQETERIGDAQLYRPVQ